MSTEETFHAWSEEPEEETEVLAVIRRRLFDARIIPAVITGVAVAAVSIAGTLALTPGPDHFTIRPAPVEQVPAPPKAAAPKPVQPPPAAAPPVAAPPAEHLVQPPPPDAQQTFTRALKSDTPETQGGNGLYPTQPASTIDSEAKAMCQDLANGGSIQPYIDGTLQKSPTLAPWQAALAVHQAVEAYCPQLAR